EIWSTTGLVFARKIIDHEFFELICFIDHVMRNTERMRNATRVRYGLWPATFVRRPRNAVLRPHLHRHSNDIVALLAQQITSNAGIDSTAHAEKHALFISRIHPRKIGESARSVNVARGIESEAGQSGNTGTNIWAKIEFTSDSCRCNTQMLTGGRDVESGISS